MSTTRGARELQELATTMLRGRDHARRRRPQARRFKRMSGAVATATLALLPVRDGDSLVGPRAEQVGILQQLVRQLVIAHDFAILAVGPEWAHAPSLELRSSGIINLQIERVMSDQGKEHVARIDANPTKHAPGADLWEDATQLLDDEGSKTRADGH